MWCQYPTIQWTIRLSTTSNTLKSIKHIAIHGTTSTKHHSFKPAPSFTAIYYSSHHIHTTPVIIDPCGNTRPHGLITVSNRQRKYKIDIERYRNTVRGLLQSINGAYYDISITFTTNQSIKKLNQQYRSIDHPTDILTFTPQILNTPTDQQTQQLINTPQQDNYIPVILPSAIYDSYDLGDIYISVEYCDKQAGDVNQSLYDRLVRLTVHGILHCCGYDHELNSDYELMHSTEQQLMNSIQHLLDDPKYIM